MTRIGFCCIAAACLMLAASDSAEAQFQPLRDSHCGCGYTQKQAADLWAGYCQEQNCGQRLCGFCGKRGCRGACRAGCNGNCFGWPGANQCCNNNCGQVCGNRCDKGCGLHLGCRGARRFGRCLDDACGFANRVHNDISCGIKSCGRRIEQNMCDFDFRPTCGRCGHRFFGLGCHHCGHHGPSLKLFSGVRGCGQCDLGCGNNCGGCNNGCANNNCFGWNNNAANCCGRSYFHRDYHFAGNFFRRMHSWYGCGNDCNGCGCGDYGYGYTNGGGGLGTPYPAGQMQDNSNPNTIEQAPGQESGNEIPGPDTSYFVPSGIRSTSYPNPASVIPRTHNEINSGRSIQDYSRGYIN